ncbi:hypothetical protein CHUAL_001733 [Chamberlinius hualienensis]
MSWICYLSDFLLLVLISMHFTPDCANCLRMTRVDIPPHRLVGDSVQLHCIFDMEGAELYSVKWYKESAEFYRYLPKDHPPAQVYEVAGVDVDLSMSGENVVMLHSLSLSTAGHYRCEVSAEAPSFATVHGEGEMNVIASPKDIPQITGAKSRYQVGDTVSTNCTSHRSKPAAMLSWTINSFKAPKEILIEYPTTIYEDSLETSVLGLQFQIRESHFIEGVMKLKCSATIAPVYHNSNEESVFNTNVQASVMESKETPSHTNHFPVTANHQGSNGAVTAGVCLWLCWIYTSTVSFLFHVILK